jgi:hypothetical protein
MISLHSSKKHLISLDLEKKKEREREREKDAPVTTKIHSIVDEGPKK